MIPAFLFHRQQNECSPRERRLLGIHEQTPRAPVPEEGPQGNELGSVSPEHLPEDAAREAAYRQEQAAAMRMNQQLQFADELQYKVDLLRNTPGIDFTAEFRKINNTDPRLHNGGVHMSLINGEVQLSVYRPAAPLSPEAAARTSKLSEIATQIKQIDKEIRGLMNEMVSQGRKFMSARNGWNFSRNPGAAALGQMAMTGINALSPQLQNLQNMRIGLIGTYNAIKSGREKVPVPTADTGEESLYGGEEQQYGQIQPATTGENIYGGNAPQEAQLALTPEQQEQMIAQGIDDVFKRIEADATKKPIMESLKKRFEPFLNQAKAQGIDLPNFFAMIASGSADAPKFLEKVKSAFTPETLAKLEETIKGLSDAERDLLREIAVSVGSVAKQAEGLRNPALSRAPTAEEKEFLRPHMEAFLRPGATEKEKQIAEAQLMINGVDTATISAGIDGIKMLPEGFQRLMSLAVGVCQLMSAYLGKETEADVAKRQARLDTAPPEKMTPEELKLQITLNKTKLDKIPKERERLEEEKKKQQTALDEAIGKKPPVKTEIDAATQALENTDKKLMDLKSEQKEVEERLAVLQAPKKAADTASDKVIADFEKGKAEALTYFRTVLRDSSGNVKATGPLLRELAQKWNVDIGDVDFDKVAKITSESFVKIMESFVHAISLEKIGDKYRIKFEEGILAATIQSIPDMRDFASSSSFREIAADLKLTGGNGVFFSQPMVESELESYLKTINEARIKRGVGSR